MSENNNADTVSVQTKHDLKQSFFSSVAAGGIVGGFFHPVDRALQLSIANGTRFLNKVNFVQPWQGIGFVLSSKPITSGSYLLMQTELREHYYPWLCQQGFHASTANMILGSACGIFDGITKAPINTLKTYTFKYPGSKIRSNAELMYKQGGSKIFFRGALTTTVRDAMWGGIYESSRWFLRGTVDQYVPNQTLAKVLHYVSDGIAAGAGVLGCSPFNYLRIMKQNTEIGQPTPNFFQAMDSLARKANAQPTFWKKTRSIMQSLGIGPGTLRVMADMPAKQFLLVVIPTLIQNFKTFSEHKKNNGDNIQSLNNDSNNFQTILNYSP